MSNIQSYNALIDRFKAFAAGHFILKRFSHGQIEVSDLEKFGEYPFMHVVPSNVTYSKGMKTFSFQIVLADLPRDKEDKTEYQREVLSDLQRIAEDLVAEITNHRVLFGDLITVNNVSLEPFLEEFQHTLTGWTISLDLLVPYYWDACSIPAEWNDMFESSTDGIGSILTFTDSITRDENGFVRLVNDEAEPAPNYYYGTDDEGVRGWYLLTDEVGLTCVTLPSCQTIIDIEAAIDLLQTDVTDLQSDVSSLDTNKVPYTGATGNVDLGEYELKAGQIEFDQTPTGTAGVGVMRWNDTDGTVDVGLKGGNVTLQVGQENVIRVVNKSGSNLLEANYQAVRVRLVAEGGAQGQRLAVVLALADNDADSATTIGLVTETINNNQEGFVTTSGEVKNINTTGSLQGETWVDGDILYLSGTTSGRITNVKPSAPTHTIIIGYVVYAHANNGKIFVKVDNGYELDELHNVSITSPTDNQALVYESASSLWKNETVDKTFVGLGNVDNTSDLNKPISTATQTALNAKQDTLVSGTNIKTINGNSVLGSGDLAVSGSNIYNADGSLTAARTLTLNTFALTILGTTSSRFFANGNVAIGTTTDAGYKLDVNGISRVNGSLVLGTYGSGTGVFWDNSTNNLGIGNTSPGQKIDILGTNIVATKIKSSTNTGASSYQAFNDVNNSYEFGMWGSTRGGYGAINSGNAYLYGSIDLAITSLSNIKFGVGSTPNERMRIVGSTGNVLINTTTDAGYKLDVNGTARVSGNTTIVGTLSGGSANTVTGTYSMAYGYNNRPSGQYSVALNNDNRPSGQSSTAINQYNSAEAVETFSHGVNAKGYLRGQKTHGGLVISGTLGTYGVSQSSELIAGKDGSLTTASTFILTLSGGDLIIPSGNNRAWNVQIDTVAIVTAITGTATGVSVGDCYRETKQLLFKRVGGTSSIVGTVDTTAIKADSGMATAILTITAGGSQQMALTFTAPTFAGGGSVTLRVVSKVSLVESAY